MCFAKTIFYFLRADLRSSCSIIVQDEAVNLGDGEEIKVPFKLRLSGQRKFVNVLQQELNKLQ